MKNRKPGTVAANQIPIYDGKGRQRGHVGPKATSVTVARFIGTHGAKLGKVKGRTAWIGPPLADVSAAGTTAGAPAPVESANKKSARGSNPPPRTSWSYPK